MSALVCFVRHCAQVTGLWSQGTGRDRTRDVVQVSPRTVVLTESSDEDMYEEVDENMNDRELYARVMRLWQTCPDADARTRLVSVYRMYCAGAV